MDEHQSPAQARLNHWGWSAGSDDLKQWLQVDLGSYIRVTQVATQGVNPWRFWYWGRRWYTGYWGRRWYTGYWVTSYRLQYSDEGFIFHFYQEPSDTSAKVYSGFQDFKIHY